MCASAPNRLPSPRPSQPITLLSYQWKDGRGLWQSQDGYWGGFLAKGQLEITLEDRSVTTVQTGYGYMVQAGKKVKLRSKGGDLVEWRWMAQKDSCLPFWKEMKDGHGPHLAPNPLKVILGPPTRELEHWRHTLTHSSGPWALRSFWGYIASYTLDISPGLTALNPLPLWLNSAIDGCCNGNTLREGVRGLNRLSGRSPSQVRRMVQHSFGCSASELITQLRILRSKELLLRTDLTLEAIAENVGWRSLPWFHKVFRDQHGGLSPTQWKKEQLS